MSALDLAQISACLASLSKPRLSVITLPPVIIANILGFCDPAAQRVAQKQRRRTEGQKEEEKVRNHVLGGVQGKRATPNDIKVVLVGTRPILVDGVLTIKVYLSVAIHQQTDYVGGVTGSQLLENLYLPMLTGTPFAPKYRKGM